MFDATGHNPNPIGRRAIGKRRRLLLLERLEERRLLTTAEVIHDFRDEDFSIAGSFSYALRDGDYYRDAIPDGQYRSTSGHITWDGPRLGKGSFVGIAEGDGDDFVRVGGSMRACSSYGIDDRGELGFDIDALAGTLLITENNLESTAYTYYVDHTGGNCPAPNPPWSRFFGGITNLYVGSFDPVNSTAAIRYDDANLDIVIDAPPASVVWQQNEATQLTLTVDVPPPDFEVPEGWIVVEQTSESPEEIDFIHLDSGIDIKVEVQGRPLPVSGDVEQAAAEVKLYWYDTEIGVQNEQILLDSSDELFGVYWNTQVLHARVKDFPEPPSWANFVKIEVDTIGSETTSDNSVILRIETFEASNTVTPVEITEDQVLNGLLGSIMHIRDSSDPDVKLYAYDPKSAVGAAVQVVNDEGAFYYDPTQTPEIQQLRPGEELSDGMNFVAVKYQRVFSYATHVVLLVGVNDLPIVVNEEDETSSDRPLTFYPAANDVDIDRDDFVVLHSVPETSDLGARLTRGEDGSVLYDPTVSEELTNLLIDDQLVDQFEYEVIDTFGGKSTGTVTVTVIGVGKLPGTKIVLPSTQYTIRNMSTSAVPFTVSHTTLDPAQLTVTARSLRPSVVADDQITLQGSGSNRTVTITPTVDQIGRVPIELTVTDPSGDSAQGIFQLFVGSADDQDLDGIGNDDEDAGINGGDANSDGVLDRFQANVISLVAGPSSSRLMIAVPENAYFQDVFWSTAPAAEGIAEGAVFPLGLLNFTLELPQESSGVEMDITSDYTDLPLNSAYFYSQQSNEPGWQHLMRNELDGVRVFADHMAVKTLDGGRTDDGDANDGFVMHSLALASLQNPWRNDLPEDVNNNGQIQPIDALIVLNYLNRRSVRELPARLVDDDQIPNFLDVSGDGKVSPIDALIVINRLNRNPPGSGGGEGEFAGDIGVGRSTDFFPADVNPWHHDDEWRIRRAAFEAAFRELF